MFFLGESRFSFAASMLAGPAAAEPVHVMTPVDTSLVYPEGTIFDGNVLLLADMKRGGIFRFNGGSVSAVWRDDQCGPTSLAPLPSGLWLVACHLTHEVVFLDLSDLGAPREIARTPFRRPNDMYAGHDGVYVSRSGEFEPDAPITGEVWLVRTPADQRRVESGIHYANGVAVTHDGRYLLVCEHLEHRVWRYPIKAQGSLGERALAFDLTSVLPTLAPLEGPDGIEPARDGSFYVAVYGRGMVLHVSAAGMLLERFTTPGYPKLTNIALTPGETGLYAVSSMADERAGAVFYIDLARPH